MKKIGTFLAASAGLYISSIGAVLAQDNQDTGTPALDVETVYITGTFIPRQTGNLSSPISLIDREDVRAQGAITLSDIINNLTINTGSQNQTDAFTQNVSTGTTNINLRGLGVSSTLVLLNGHRQVVSGAPTDLGLLFVDTSSLVPTIAVERLEILKDGAAALYGSDAVAGVANFITRNNFEGVELSASFKGVTGASQNDITAEGLFGWGNDRAHLLAAFGYLHRSSLSTAERRFPGSLDPTNGDFSNAGFPGSFIVPYLPTGLPAPLQAAWTGVFDSAGIIPGIADFFEPLLGAPIVPGAQVPVVTDPNCAAGANSVLPSTFPFGFCRLDFGNFFDLVAEERRLQGYFSFEYELSDTATFNVEISGARSRADRNNSPSFPIPGPQGFLPNVPGTAMSYNPFNPFGPSPVLMGPTTLPLLFIGRTVGEGSPAPSTHDSDTYRIQTGFTGSFGDSGTWDISFTHGANDFYVATKDVIDSRFTLALNGLGGAGCNPMTGVPGVGGCQFFNPFGSSLTAAPGATVPNPFGGTVPVANSQTLIDWFTGDFTQDYMSRLTVVDGVITNEFTSNLPFPIGMALGFQYRHEKYSLDYDPISNADDFLFVLGGQDFSSAQDVFAVFGELSLPVHERIEIQVALRYENYDTMAGDTLDPKFGIFAEVSDTFNIRGSWGTSFRGPNIFQQFGTQTSVQQLTDTLPGQPTTPSFFAVRSSGNPMLVPESAKNFNAGFTWEPNDQFRFNFDFWRFNFTNIIVQESAQAIINANPLDPRIARDPLTGSITLINNTWTNASSLKTSGIDILAEYLIPLTNGMEFLIGGEATYILKYDLVDPQVGFVSGAGRRNFANFGVSTPELRFMMYGNARSGPHDAYIFVRYIDSYADDQNGGAKISSHTTVDLQYNFILGDPEDEKAFRFTVGVINVFNNLPPIVLTNLGFDTKVHNPLGRQVYGKITKGF